MSENYEIREHRTTEMVDAIFAAIPKTREGQDALKHFHRLITNPMTNEHRIPMIISFSLGLCALLPARQAIELMAKSDKWIEEL